MARVGYRIAGCAVACFGAVWCAMMTRPEHELALIQFGNAIGTALLIGLPKRSWPAGIAVIVMASTLSATLHGVLPFNAVLLSLLLGTESAIAAALLVRFRPALDWLDDIRGIGSLVIAGGIVAPLMTAVPAGLVTLRAAGRDLRHADARAGGGAFARRPVFPLCRDRCLAECPSSVR